MADISKRLPDPEQDTRSREAVQEARIRDQLRLNRYKPISEPQWWSKAALINAMLPIRCAATKIRWDAARAEALYRRQDRVGLTAQYRALYESETPSEHIDFRLRELIEGYPHSQVSPS